MLTAQMRLVELAGSLLGGPLFDASRLAAKDGRLRASLFSLSFRPDPRFFLTGGKFVWWGATTPGATPVY
jgi:hypothetical protein